MMARLAIGFLPIAVMFAAKKVPEWKTGKVLDSEKAKSTVVTGSTSETSGDASSSTTDTKVRTIDIRTTQVVIVGEEFAYIVNDTRNGGSGNIYTAIGHAVANRKHGCRYIIGDQVKYYQDKGTLHVIDADGKECKTEIMRQERLKK